MTLSEPCRRVLARIAAQMRDGATGEVVIRLHEGGVRDYRESRTYRPGQMDTPDGDVGELIDALDGGNGRA
jgi:hypothetical protein